MNSVIVIKNVKGANIDSSGVRMFFYCSSHERPGFGLLVKQQYANLAELIFKAITAVLDLSYEVPNSQFYFVEEFLDSLGLNDMYLVKELEPTSST